MNARTVVISIGAVIVVFVAAVAYVLRDPSPVGYFRSGRAADRFQAAYREAMADMPVPDRTLDLRTGYGVVRVYHFSGGPGPPLLLLPGRASASPVWADNMPSLLRLSSVYTVDLLGEPGLSIQQRPVETPADHAQWLHELVQALPEPQIHLFGLSFGGWTAMNLAVHHPEKIAGVILLDPIMVFGGLSAAVIWRSIPVAVPWAPRSWRDDFASWTANDAPVQDLPVARMIEAGLQAYVVKLSAPTRPTDDQLRGLIPPMLLLMAGRSRMHDSAAVAATARSLLPQATVKTYPNASHAINGEHPDEIAADIAAFLP
ncbi:alpha/beta fold hydrolase [Catenuloplanes sp. NPDC051500]|uniref:alpha/beta fold hydrolase n=1 Tax=Catenuloplanes sp. NPDC051500 TaxID=3363959 RepID=UPI0037B44342